MIICRIGDGFINDDLVIGIEIVEQRLFVILELRQEDDGPGHTDNEC